MSGLEEAIRKALDNADREDTNARARIYQAARRALESGLANQSVKDPKAIAKQRRGLDDIIAKIENEEAARARAAKAGRGAQSPVFDDPFAVGRVAETSREPSFGSDLGGAETDGRFEPSLEAEPVLSQEDDGFFPEPSSRDDVPAAPVDDFTAADFHSGRDEPMATGHLETESLHAADDLSVSLGDRSVSGRGRKPKKRKAGNLDRIAAPKASASAGKARSKTPPPRRRRWFTRAFITIMFLALIAFGVWWVMQSGFTMNPQSRDTAVPNPPPRIEAEDFEGSSSWTDVYTPGSNGGIVPGTSASAQNVTVEGETALRITSNNAGDSGAVAFTLPPAVAQMLQDGPVLLEATVMAPQGGGQPIGVSCADSDIQGCQRHRFQAPAYKDSIVIRLDPRDGNPPSRMLVSSDLSGSGRPLDIYAVRARSDN